MIMRWMRKPMTRALRPGRGPLILMVLVALVAAACGTDAGNVAEPSEPGTSAADAGSPSESEMAETGEPLKVRVSTAVPEASAIGETMKLYFDYVEEQDAGITFEVFWAGSLLPITDTAAGIRDGRTDAGYLNSAYVADVVPLWSVAEVPFTTSNSEAQVRAFTELGENDQQFRSGFESAGMVPLFFIPLGSSTLGTNQPMDELSDFEGLRLRSTGLMEGAVAAAGAETLFIPIQEVFPSLQQGVVDGWSSINFEYLPVADYHTLRDHVTHSGIGIAQSIGVFLNADMWDGLSQGQQDVLRTAANEIIPDAVDILTREQDAACTAIAEEGGTVAAMPEPEVEAWRELAEERVIETWLGRLEEAGIDREDGDAFLQSYRDAVAEFESQSDFEDGALRCAAASG